jgi:hypothetical protein
MIIGVSHQKSNGDMDMSIPDPGFSQASSRTAQRELASSFDLPAINKTSFFGGGGNRLDSALRRNAPFLSLVLPVMRQR